MLTIASLKYTISNGFLGVWKMKTTWNLNDIRPYENEPLHFSGTINLEERLLNKTKRILSAEDTHYEGYFFFDPELQEYQLSLSAKTNLVLPSTRSLEPVNYLQELSIFEIYLEEDNTQAIEMYEDNELVLILETDSIDISQVLLENIVLSLPSQILTDQEKSGGNLPKGENWQVMTESQYQESKTKYKQENSPFNQLKALFDEENTDDA